MQTEECIAAALTEAPTKPLIHVFVDQNNFHHVGRDLRAKLAGLDTVYADGRRYGKKMQARLVRATQSEYAKLG